MSRQMTELTIGGVDYRLGKLNPRVQFHVGRRLAPFYGAIVGGKAATPDLEALVPMLDKLAEMPDDQLDYILDHCLAVVERKNASGGWAKVAAADGQMMFEDISAKAMLQLAWGVVQQDLQGFFPGND